MRTGLGVWTLVLGLGVAAGVPRLAPAQERGESQVQRAREEVGELFDKAFKLLQDKKYDEAIATYERVLELVPEADLPEQAAQNVVQIAHYNLACAYALSGKSDEALDHFEKAVEAGFTDWEHIEKDSDLDSIRDLPRFREIVARGRKAAEKAQAARFAEQRRQIVAQISDKALFPFDFEVRDLAGVPLKLADLRGKVVLIDIWGTWCPPCRAELPHLIELYKKHKDEGFTIVGLNRERMPYAQAVAHVRDFVSEHGVPYRCAVIGPDLLRKIPGFRGFPTMLLVDREGRVRLMKVGYTEGVVLDAAIEKLLAEGRSDGADSGADSADSGKGSDKGDSDKGSDKGDSGKGSDSEKEGGRELF